MSQLRWLHRVLGSFLVVAESRLPSEVWVHSTIRALAQAADVESNPKLQSLRKDA